MAGISSWSRGDRIAFVSLIVAIVGVIAAIVVVPEVRVFLGLEHPKADVIVCLTDTRYVADPNPAPDRGVVEPVYLQTTFDLRNRGSAQANVTFIHIAVLGIKNGSPITSNPDYGPRSPIPIAENGEVPHIIVDLLVDQRAAVQSFESAQSRVDWEGGTGQTIKHIFDGAQWQNDPACSS